VYFTQAIVKVDYGARCNAANWGRAAGEIYARAISGGGGATYGDSGYVYNGAGSYWIQANVPFDARATKYTSQVGFHYEPWWTVFFTYRFL